VSTPLANSRSGKRAWPAWLAPILAVLVLGAIGGFFFWYWYGGATIAPEQLSREALAEAVQQYPAPGSRPPLAAAKAALLARLASMFPSGAARVAPGRATAATTQPAMAPLRIAHHGSIAQARAGGPVNIMAGPYTLVATPNARGRPGYQYKFNVHADAVYGTEDAQLFHLGSQIASSQFAQQNSGASAEQIAALKSKFGAQLRTPTLALSPEQSQTMDRLWLQFLVADPGSRQGAAITLLDAVAALGPKAVAANKASLGELAASLHEMLPDSQAQAYQAALDAAAAARSATRPSTRPGA
jgi:hypothetical protein